MKLDKRLFPTKHEPRERIAAAPGWQEFLKARTNAELPPPKTEIIPPLPNRPRGLLHEGRNFTLTKDGDTYAFIFQEAPSEERLRILQHMKFKPAGELTWVSTDKAKADTYAKGVAVWMDGGVSRSMAG